MTTYSEKKLVPYAPAQLFALVADVGKYPSFLPWCAGARIRSHVGNEIVADLTIGFGPFRESFTSRVTLVPPDATGTCAINVKYENGPFKYLHNRWNFLPDAAGCVVDFYVDFEFRNFVLQKAIGAVFGEAVRLMVSAFLRRARTIYGPPVLGVARAGIEESKAGA
jgi:coenzyme Q-binding protein COQ10